MHYHLVARTYSKNTPFADPQKAHWIWHQLKVAFPDTLAATLMPNHLHIVLKSDCPDKNRLSLAKILGRFTFVFKEKSPLWQPIPKPNLITDQDKLRRDIRYVLLNPCRARLCKDPLEWPWSTYRGSVGAMIQPWVKPRTFLSAMQAVSLPPVHRYITSDPSVCVGGTPLPTPAQPCATLSRSLTEIAQAVIATTEDWVEHLDFSPHQRNLFVQMACHQGWSDTGTLAQFLNLSRSTIWRLTQQSKIHPDSISATALCLGDHRLRQRMPSYSNL